MKKKYSFGGIAIAVLKCVAYIAVWFGVQLAVTFVAEVAMRIQNPGLPVDDFLKLVMSKSTEISMLSNLVMILAFAIFYTLRRSSIKNAIRLNPMPVPFGFSALMLGVAAQFAIIFILNIIPFPEELVDSLNNNYEYIGQSGMVVRYLSVAFVGPVAEEVLFRGLVLNKLNQNMNSWVAIIISSLIFGAMHGTVIGFIYATAVGIIMGWLYIKFDSILPCALFHIAFNTTSLIISQTGASVLVCIFSIFIVISEIVTISKYHPN